MSSWARRAADISSVVTSCGHPGASAPEYTYRLEKVKFGVPLEEVCKNNENIPGPLLVLILKLNKESPNRRDVFRAPGHQGAMKKLIHFLQSGRLVNVDNYSVYTIASVLKKFLRKIPNGIFGRTGEKELFDIIELENESEQTDRLHRLFTSLPKYTQRLLVLLFGTFRVIASNATQASTGMTSEALGVSVAPSFFQSCVSDGKTARMEDVLKFKVATKIMKQIIDKFATHDLFGRENYEYYARVTGRILKVQDEWICSFQYPPPPRGKLAQQKYALQHSLEAEKTWLQCQCERWGLLAQEESRSTPALLTSSSSALDNSVLSLGVTPEHSFIESCARLSVSLEGPSLFAMTSSPIPKRNIPDLQRDTDNDADVDEDNFGDEDADANDGGEVGDFAAELEINNDEDFENNPKANFPSRMAVQSGLHRAVAARGNNRHVIHSNAALNTTYTVSIDNDDVVDSNDDDGDDEVTVVRRRYRQNKKKILTQTRMQHQRRLRAGSKSLDGGDRSSQTPLNNETNENRNKMKNNKIQSTTTTQISSGTSGGIKATTRTCSRCNRGIRHSSSCSSASGGGAGSVGNGGGMTMEELRAVNRYAESTKSLSYLPQVHERQTARMRTRSEWFLGPRDSELALNLPTTCSNCCFSAVQKQQLQLQQQQHPHFQTHGYLGGGSTRDMRAHCSGFDNDEDDNVHNLIVSNSGGHNANALYLYYKKRLQQQQRMNTNSQQVMQTEHMDTDDSCNAYDYGPPTYQCKQHLQVDTSNVHSQSSELRVMEPTSSAYAIASNSSGRRMYLDPNTTTTNIGSYVTSHKSSNNYYLYDSNDTTNASTFTTNSIATTFNSTSTTTTTTLSLQTNSISTSAKFSIDISHNYNYNTNNNSETIYIENANCNNNNIEINNTNQTLLASNLQHTYKLSNTKYSHSATKPVSTNYEPHQRNHQHFSSQIRNIDSPSYLYTHSQSPNHIRQHQVYKRGSKLPSHYHSTDSVRYCDVDLDVEIVTEPTMHTSRLFYSPRKQVFSARRCNSTHDLYKIKSDDVEVNSDLDHNYLTYSLPSDQNRADFDTVTEPSILTNRVESCEVYSDSSEFFNASLLDNSLAPVSTTSEMIGTSGLPLAAAEEVDFIHTSRYRQSTPRVQRRQQQLRRQQSLASTSTQYHSMNSTNASSLLMTTADGGNGSDSGNGRNTRTDSGNNFVTVIFNVLDFLF
ncbi:myb-like protein P isoform X1 [Bactrocera tryoni]|uniref:myb-like protein P isoform X1 n=1 Tax=Bactrocera tryoni TaxID=59916 RepID=UPI001A982CA8|nr:myb-like protein P isoform X1 [Bactrocera tryoni]XP_039967261.1 myb-like protein P isoform X1 [Bactrocera tryoni]XP_039967262.1 myb-like protein P isoform X1 [Bactrocera tryoni]